ncbi:MAG: FAD-binding oxidoreductase [Bacteroidetes bacterium]|nr:MAG: FAD-binding oxidoreductase [Bacteroidota bacterium]
MKHLEQSIIEEFSKAIKGRFLVSEADRLMYATDASAYREIPLAVAIPQTKEDIRQLILLARKYQFSLIPRAAGTSLAGQVVGGGIVVDISQHLNHILHFDPKKREITVEPGVILDDLNRFLKPHGLFFGPEASTASRCNIAGMVGNNACGLHSLVYGSTREHTKCITAFLSDGTEATFTSLSPQQFQEKCRGNRLENALYRQAKSLQSDEKFMETVRREFPHPEVVRRNTGYALDLLLDSPKEEFNFCKLLAGSEGTLAFFTEITLNLVPLPPPNKILVCVHLRQLEEALHANLIALKYQPSAIEMMDDTIISLAAKNKLQRENSYFIKGSPAAILIVEFMALDEVSLKQQAQKMEEEMRAAGYGYHFPLIEGKNIQRVWALRKAGLGVLSNTPGDARPVSVTEDTAVHPRLLPDYIGAFTAMMARYGKECVYHAHIATGELHLRPILNLKKQEDVELFHRIALESAHLVKKYRGSLSGEHGDGRLRGEFIPLMVGEEIYQVFREVKRQWDPQNLFNPGKITDTPPMNTSLRYEPGKETRQLKTWFDFSRTQGIVRAAEKCNGSGDCRKPAAAKGTMCPSYMATRDEKNSTRARANILREYLSNSPKTNPFDHREIYEVMDLCLSCKACKSECPSNVDVAKLKAEFLQHYYQKHPIPIRTLAIAYLNSFYRIGMVWPALMNFFMTQPFFSKLLKRSMGFATERSMPKLTRQTLRGWMRNHIKKHNSKAEKGTVYLFADEFTNYLDTSIGVITIQLINELGYQVIIPNHGLSARTFLSKGMLKKARKILSRNVRLLAPLISEETPLVGIEPSAILGFRDEYPDLAEASLQEQARKIASNTLLFEEFFMREVKKGNITEAQFTEEAQSILLHGHCQQKAVASTLPLREMLSFPKAYDVEEIPSGCCGMAGAFGYEKEHYSLSQKVGELVLLPAVRNAKETTLIVAPGTSCRHQIKDGTGRTALHPVEVMKRALKKQG